MPQQIISSIADAIERMEIIDTHEHLCCYEKDYNKEQDVLNEYLEHYLMRDLLSAGLPKEDLKTALQRDRSIEERFSLLAPYWEASRYTGYGRALDIAAADLYGIDSIRQGTIAQLNDAYRKSMREKDLYRRILKEKSRIRLSVVDQYGDQCDTDFFRLAFNIGPLVSPSSQEFMRVTGEKHGLTVRSFSDWLEVCELEVMQALAKDAVCLKCAMAYDRSIHFPRVSYEEAESAYIQSLSISHLPEWNNRALRVDSAFENYVMHHILRIAESRGVAIQFHTGLQEGSGNILSNSNPLLLSNLFLEYPGLRFDLFHISYPFMGEAGALCKNFPNVFLDMCWAHIISPRACIDTLDEWLDAVPYNKISAFGGDYILVDGVYGHQKMARQNVAATLSRKVLRGDFSEDAAIRIAEHLFILNPLRILGIE